MALKDYVKNKPQILTDRLILRELRRDDVNSLKEWILNKKIYEYWGKGLSVTDKNPSKLFEKKESDKKSFHFGIAIKNLDIVIGEIWVYLIENDRMAKVAIRIGRKYQGNGYGREALCGMTGFIFKNTEIKRLWTDVDIRNIASIKILESCGYIREGLIRQGKMVNTYCDYYIYAKLVSD